jgi:hypothetical protein
MQKLMTDYENLRDLDRMLIHIAKSTGPSEALHKARAANASNRVLQTLEKATVPAADTTAIGATGLGNQFGEFYSQARQIGAADAMSQYAVRSPSGYARYNIMSKVVASTVSEGAAKPVRRLSMSTTDVTPAKGAIQMVFTRELVDGLGAANVMASIRRELTRSVVEWTDSALLASLTGNSNDTQGTDSIADFLTVDFEELLQLVGSSSSSALWLIVTPSIAKSLAAHLLTQGVNVQNWHRFDLAGVTVTASDAQTSGRATLVAADALAMWLSPVDVRSSETCDVEMSDAPGQTSATTIGSSQMVSLFGTNSLCFQVERSAAIKPLTSNSYAHLTNIAFGVVDSPRAA